jgi:hypothetical protein
VLSFIYDECRKKPIMLCVFMLNVVMLSVVAPKSRRITLSLETNVSS